MINIRSSLVSLRGFNLKQRDIIRNGSDKIAWHHKLGDLMTPSSGTLRKSFSTIFRFRDCSSQLFCRNPIISLTSLNENGNNSEASLWSLFSKSSWLSSATTSSGRRCLASSATSSSSSSDVVRPSPRPFQVLGLQQVAIGNTSRSDLQTLWYDIMGLTSSETHTLPSENVQEDIVRLGPTLATPADDESSLSSSSSTDSSSTRPSVEGLQLLLQVELDLMTPLDVQAKPAVHQPPLNHIGLWVDDLPAAVEWLSTVARVRLTPGGIRVGAAGYPVAFIHPKGNETHPHSGQGVLIELVQAPPSVIQAYRALTATTAKTSTSNVSPTSKTN